MRAYSRKRVMITYKYVNSKGDVSSGGTVYHLTGRHKMTEGDLVKAYFQIKDAIMTGEVWFTGYQYM